MRLEGYIDRTVTESSGVLHRSGLLQQKPASYDSSTGDFRYFASRCFPHNENLPPFKAQVAFSAGSSGPRWASDG